MQEFLLEITAILGICSFDSYSENDIHLFKIASTTCPLIFLEFHLLLIEFTNFVHVELLFFTLKILKNSTKIKKFEFLKLLSKPEFL